MSRCETDPAPSTRSCRIGSVGVVNPRINEYGQPIGPPVPDWSPAPFPDVTVMQGEWCRLEPLMHHHTAELFAELCAPEEAPAWTYLSPAMPADESAFSDLVDDWATATDRVTVVVRTPDGRARGIFSFLRIDRANGSVEIGAVHFGPNLRRTPAATEALYLAARHLFTIGYRRCEWKCDSLNAASIRAAERFGFVREGLFRKAVVTKGRQRDTVWFSITDDEWPGRRAALEAWLAPANHTEAGQVRRLEEFRAEV